jgi:hypothetical protein
MSTKREESDVRKFRALQDKKLEAMRIRATKQRTFVFIFTGAMAEGEAF